jgi:Rps23 Pro-64 3,4-dihydroxylase Tpa1-like proline 4-hydroxylase
MNETDAIFNHPKTYEWIAGMSGRVTHGENKGAASRYFPGDFSMPHADFYDMRTVAYVWHLSKDWNPNWGGALYWCGEPNNQ